MGIISLSDAFETENAEQGENAGIEDRVDFDQDTVTMQFYDSHLGALAERRQSVCRCGCQDKGRNDIVPIAFSI